MGLPSGLVTFVFTDVEGSTQLFHDLGEGYVVLLEQQRALVRSAVQRHQGYEVSAEGDGFFLAFQNAGAAVAACLDAQLLLTRHRWDPAHPMRVRMGAHTGQAVPTTDDDYVAVAVHQAARVAATAHGGQVVLSDETARLVRAALPDQASLTDLGSYVLKDFPEPQSLHQLVHPELLSWHPPLRAARSLAALLPVARTTFLGRDRELEALGPLLRRTRLVTVVGPGGIGKTRLAMAFATPRASRYTGGARWCDLSNVDEPSLVVGAVLRAFGLEDAGATSSLVDKLAGRTCLLVLDNCEQVVEAVADLLAVLLEQVPGLEVVATSRIPLDVEGEQVLRLGSLDLPRADEPPGAVRATSAAQLFAHRASLAVADFELRDDDLPVVAEVCRALDGLPLAIELVAARAGDQTLGQLRDLVLDPETTLTVGRRRGATRQRTLESTIAWSYDLLDEDLGRGALRALSVFAGGASQDAIVKVLGELASGVAELERHSLATRRDDGRVVLLESIRLFAGQELDKHGERSVVALRHLQCFLELASHVEQLPDSDRDESGFPTLDEELENLRAALGAALVVAPELGADLVGALRDYFWRLGPREGARWTERVLGVMDDQPSPTLLKVLGVARASAGLLGDHEASLAYSARAVAVSEQVDDPALRLRALAEHAGALAGLPGRGLEAAELMKAALGVADELGREVSQLRLTANLAGLLRHYGDLAEAEAYGRRSMGLLHAGGLNDVCVAHLNLAWTLLRSGAESAAASFDRAAAAALSSGSPLDLAWTLVGLAALWVDRAPEAAAALMAACGDVQRRHAIVWDEADRRDATWVEGRLLASLGPHWRLGVVERSDEQARELLRAHRPEGRAE